MRIVSLLPGATDILCALGLGPMIVGRSHECDAPEAVHAAVCTQAKISSQLPTHEVDELIRASASEGSALYNIDLTLLEELGPELIITQRQCAVCAVSEESVRSVVGHGSLRHTVVLALLPARFDDLWSDIARIAEAVGDRAAGQSLTKRLRGTLADLICRPLHGSTSERGTISVGCFEWLAPLMGCGSWIPDLLTMAGFRCETGVAGLPAEYIQPGADARPWSDEGWSDLGAVICMPCGRTLVQVREEWTALRDKSPWSNLLERELPIFGVDASALFTRPGPRLIDSLAVLFEIRACICGTGESPSAQWTTLS